MGWVDVGVKIEKDVVLIVAVIILVWLYCATVITY